MATALSIETGIANITPHQWKQGQSGNPKGRPPINVDRVIAKSILCAGAPECARMMLQVADGQIKVSQTRFAAIKYTLDRVLGRIQDAEDINKEMKDVEKKHPAQMAQAELQNAISNGKRSLLESLYKSGELAEAFNEFKSQGELSSPAPEPAN